MKISKNVVVNLQDASGTFVSSEGDGMINIGQTAGGADVTVSLKLEDLKAALKAFGRSSKSKTGAPRAKKLNTKASRIGNGATATEATA